ncbi:MAG: GGDEF domain-containing protein [Treponemataceae bacterium]
MNFYRISFCFFVILLYLLLYYFKSKRLKNMATRYYQYVLYCGFCVLAIDLLMIRLEAMTNLSSFFYLVANQVYHCIIITFYFFVSVYLVIIVKNKLKKNLLFCLSLVFPYLLMILFLFVFPLYLGREESFEKMSAIIFRTSRFAIAYFLTFILAYSIQYKKNLEKQKKASIFPFFVLIPVMIVYQSFFQDDNLFSLGTTLITLVFFMSLENPHEFLCFGGKVFNGKAFEVVFAEKLNSKKTFSIVTLLYNHIEDCDTYDQEEEILIEVAKIVEKKSGVQGFIPLDQYIVFITDNDKADKIKEFAHNYIADVKIAFEKKMDFRIFQYDFGTDFTNIHDFFVKIQNKRDEALRKIAYFDSDLGIKNRNAFENERAFIDKNIQTFSSVWCAILDVNDLKIINDGQGHFAGDQLLRDFAEIITSSLGNANEAYRIGGDEFLIIQLSRTKEEIAELLDRIETARVEKNKTRTFPLNFALGHSFFDHSCDSKLGTVLKRADELMYQNKKKMKAEI